jgi:hypothetical protein
MWNVVGCGGVADVGCVRLDTYTLPAKIDESISIADFFPPKLTRISIADFFPPNYCRVDFFPPNCKNDGHIRIGLVFLNRIFGLDEIRAYSSTEAHGRFDLRRYVVTL